MPVSLPPGMLTPRPRRLVDRRAHQTTVTRRSAEARIPGLNRAHTNLNERIPMVTKVDSTELSANQILRRQSTQHPHTLDLVESLSSEDDSGSDSDSSYNSFVFRLRRKNALCFSQIGIDELLERTVSESALNPNPTLSASYHTHATTYRISSSQYKWGRLESKKITAQLVVAPSRHNVHAESSKLLFKWVHIENPNMHFGAYMVRRVDISISVHTGHYAYFFY